MKLIAAISLKCPILFFYPCFYMETAMRIVQVYITNITCHYIPIYFRNKQKVKSDAYGSSFTVRNNRLAPSGCDASLLTGRPPRFIRHRRRSAPALHTPA